jgi:hypothetical protein
MRVFEVPSLDLGFAEQLMWWQAEIDGFKQSGLPFCLVMMEMGKLLVTSQRQREQALSHGTRDDATELGFTTTKAIEDGKKVLVERSNQAWQFEQVLMERMSMEMASGHQLPAHKPPPSDDGGTWTTPPRRQKGPRPPAPSGGGSQQQRQQQPKAEPAPSKKPAVHAELNKSKWHAAYGGDKDEDGKAPCWFYCNRPGGCLQPDAVCVKSHKAKPRDYGGKHWDQLGANARSFITAKVAAA